MLSTRSPEIMMQWGEKRGMREERSAWEGGTGEEGWGRWGERGRADFDARGA